MSASDRKPPVGRIGSSRSRSQCRTGACLPVGALPADQSSRLNLGQRAVGFPCPSSCRKPLFGACCPSILYVRRFQYGPWEARRSRQIEKREEVWPKSFLCTASTSSRNPPTN